MTTDGRFAWVRGFDIEGPAGMLFRGPIYIESLAKGALVDALVFPGQ